MSMSVRLDTPVKFLKGIGPRRADALARLGVETAQDLVWHLPRRYLDASSITPLARARVGEEVSCLGRVVTKRIVPTRKGLRVFRAVLRDASGDAGMCLAGPAVPRPHHRRRPAAAGVRAGAVLSRAADVAQGIPDPRGAGSGERGAGKVKRRGKRGRVGRRARRWARSCRSIPATEGLSHKVIRSLIQQHLDCPDRAGDRPPPAETGGELGLPALAGRAPHACIDRPRSRRRSRPGGGWRSTSCSTCRSCWCGPAPWPSGSGAGSPSNCGRPSPPT